MKLLEKFRKKLNGQILCGLCWIKCTCLYYWDCHDCPVKGYPDLDGMVCRVRNIYKEIHPRIDIPKFPSDWSTISLDSSRVKPRDLNFLREMGLGDLNFLREIKWDGSGNPIPELKGNSE